MRPGRVAKRLIELLYISYTVLSAFHSMINLEFLQIRDDRHKGEKIAQLV